MAATSGWFSSHCDLQAAFPSGWGAFEIKSGEDRRADVLIYRGGTGESTGTCPEIFGIRRKEAVTPDSMAVDIAWRKFRSNGRAEPGPRVEYESVDFWP